jgi:hypothetical protein
MAETVVAVDERGRGRLAQHPRPRDRVAAAAAQARDVLAEAEDAVGLVAEQVGLDHQPRDGAGVLVRHAAGREAAATKPRSASADGTGLGSDPARAHGHTSPEATRSLCQKTKRRCTQTTKAKRARPTRLR